MMKYLKFAGSMLLMTLLTLNQTNLKAQWDAAGPSGGYVKCMERHNGTLYAVTSDLWFMSSGFYVSNDEGNSWLKVSDESLPQDVRDVVVLDESIFAATGTGIFCSDDGGVHWVEKNNGFPAGEKWINHLAASGGTLFAAGTSSGMLKSTDKGESWVVCTTGLTDTFIYSLTATEEAVFAGTGDQMLGIFRTTNNGNTWQQINTGMAYYSDGIWHNGFYPQITSLAFSGGVLYAGTGENQGIWKSMNMGNSWTHCGNGTMNYAQYTSLAGDGTNLFAGTLIQGLLKSTDEGQSWSEVNAGLTINGEVNAILIIGNQVYAGTKGGIYSSTDTGLSWEASSTGLMAQKVTQPGFVVVSDQLFLGTESGGIFRLNEDNTSWDERTGQLPFSTWNLGALYANETALFAWDRVSRDGGMSWEMAIDYSPGTTVQGYNGPRWMEHHGYWFAFGGGENPSVYRSDDHGQNWETVTSGIAPGTAFFKLQAEGERLFLPSTEGLYFSLNDGNSWQLSNFPDLNYWSLNGAEIHVQNEVYYCGLRGGGGTIGIYVSNDSGLNWTKRGDFLVHQFVSVGDVVACSGLNLEFVNGEWINVSRIMLSQNGGQSWAIISNALNGISTLSMTAFSDKLFVSTANATGNSIHCTVDKGVHWVEIADEMPATAFTSDMIVFQNKLYAGTNGQSVWRRSMDDFASPAQPGNISGPLLPCTGATVQYTVEAVAGVSYNWQLPSGWTVISGNGTPSITVVAGELAGLVLVVPSNGFGIGPAQFIQVSAIPPIPTPQISLVNDTLFSDAAEGNQWFLNGSAIPGATQYYYVPLTEGEYSASVTIGDCSSEISDVITVILEGIDEKKMTETISIVPNPAATSFWFHLKDASIQCMSVRLRSATGKVVILKETCTDIDGRSIRFDTLHLPDGMYILEVITPHHVLSQKLIINS